MKKILSFLLLAGIILISGCTSLDNKVVENLVKQSDLVKSFLKENPNAEITITKLSSDDVSKVIDEIRNKCGLQVEIKPYWRVYVEDPDTNSRITSWVDDETREAICIYRVSSSEITTTTIKEQPKTGKGTLVMKITDTPISDTITAVYITISKVEVHKVGYGSEDEGTEVGWITITEDEKKYDLLEIKDVEELLTSKELDVGKYTQIRLYISDAKITVDGKESDLEIMSNSVKLVNEFDIEEGRITELILDFDAEESVIETGNDRYKLKPTIKVIEQTISTTTIPELPTTVIIPQETTSTTFQEPTGPDIEFKVEAVYGNKGFSSGFIEVCGKQVKSSDVQYCELNGNVNDRDADDYTCHVTFSRHTIIPNEKYKLRLYGFNSGMYPGGYGYLKLNNNWKITEVIQGIEKSLLDPLYEIEVNSNYKTYTKFTDETIDFSSRSACIYCSLCDGSGIGRFEVIVEKTDTGIENKKVVTFVIRHHMGGHQDSEMEFDCSGDLYHVSGRNLVGVVFPESVSMCSYNLTVEGKTYSGNVDLTGKNCVEIDINYLQEVSTTNEETTTTIPEITTSLSVNVTNGVTKIENPFSIGSFPKDVARQIPIGDFKVSYAVGSEIIGTKGDVSIKGKEGFLMNGMIEQDLNMVTGGFLAIYVKETNQEGSLVIKVNGNEVFNQKVTVGKIGVPIDKEMLNNYNVIEISCLDSNENFSTVYKLDKVDFGINFYGNLEKIEKFQVYPEELRNFRFGEVSFKLKDYSGQGDLIIGINSHRVYKGQPSLDFHQSFNQYDVGLTSGLNSISFASESGSSYDIEDGVLTIIREESATKSRSFEFRVDSLWNDKLEGSISFYISDTDYKGNLLVTITDTAGNKHPTEYIQSYAIGQTKTISFNKNYVDYGTNTVTFEATDGNFVISNVEIRPK